MFLMPVLLVPCVVMLPELMIEAPPLVAKAKMPWLCVPWVVTTPALPIVTVVAATLIALENAPAVVIAPVPVLLTVTLLP